MSISIKSPIVSSRIGNLSSVSSRTLDGGDDNERGRGVCIGFLFASVVSFCGVGVLSSALP